MDFSVSGDASSDPSMGASISYSESNSETMGLSDWVSHPVFQNAKLDAVPNISKYGLQYTSEGVWTSGSKDTTGWYEFNLKTITVNEQIYFTTNNWFQWAASTTSWTHTVYPGGRSLNRSWLKDL